MEVFRRWPSSTTAADLYQATGAAWPDYREDVFARLAPMPRDTVVFALAHLKDIPLAWNLAHNLGLDDDRTWSDLAKAYEKFDPLAALPVHTELVENELAEAGAQHYRNAARRLKKMRKLEVRAARIITAPTPQAAAVHSHDSTAEIDTT